MITIISRLWSVIFDLLFLLKGVETKPIEKINTEIEELQNLCEPYVDEEFWINEEGKEDD